VFVLFARLFESSTHRDFCKTQCVFAWEFMHRRGVFAETHQFKRPRRPLIVYLRGVWCVFVRNGAADCVMYECDSCAGALTHWLRVVLAEPFGGTLENGIRLDTTLAADLQTSNPSLALRQ
jgi:hypothetical protein